MGETLPRRELENTRVDLRLYSKRLMEICKELTTIAAKLGEQGGDSGGTDEHGGGHRPGQSRREDL